MTIQPMTLAQILDQDVVAPVHAAIVSTLKTLNPGLTIERHPGKVDISELVAKTVVKAPGVGVGFVKMREGRRADGVFFVTVDWVAYIVVQSAVVAGKRREKEDQGLAIGARLLAILADEEASLWGRSAILPVEATPAPELKPLFTVRDQTEGMAYYTVTWTQIIAELGASVFPAVKGQYDEATGAIDFGSEEALDSIAPWIPAPEDSDA